MLTSDPGPGVLTVRLIARALARHGRLECPTALPPPPGCSAGPTFQRDRRGKTGQRLRRRIRTNASATLGPSDCLGLSSETRTLRPTLHAGQPALLAQRNHTRRAGDLQTMPELRDALCGTSRIGRGTRRYSLRRTGVGELCGRRHATSAASDIPVRGNADEGASVERGGQKNTGRRRSYLGRTINREPVSGADRGGQ